MYLLKLFIFIIYFVTTSTCNVSVPMLGVIMTKKIQISTTANASLFPKNMAERLVEVKSGLVLRGFKTQCGARGAARVGQMG